MVNKWPGEGRWAAAGKEEPATWHPPYPECTLAHLREVSPVDPDHVERWFLWEVLFGFGSLSTVSSPGWSPASHSPQLKSRRLFPSAEETPFSQPATSGGVLPAVGAYGLGSGPGKAA